MMVALIVSSLDLTQQRIIKKQVPSWNNLFSEEGFWDLADYYSTQFFGIPARAPESTYKGKHEDFELEESQKVFDHPFVTFKAGTHGFPKVTSLETSYKN